ncbi:MAG: TlpA disulfide reductase family protein [Hydrogenophaga sp.]|jgi:peroxiredoxin|nr:TlpA disulfide reductase family protein [Hydrogenophaga sp.]
MTPQEFFSAAGAVEASSRWTRREWLRASGVAGLFAGAGLPTLAQPVSAAAEEAKAPPLPAIGSELNLPRITLLDGSVHEPAASAGKPLLVYWWSSTCPFCALQSPSMEKLWQSQKARGLQMVALSIDKKPEDATAYLQKKGYSFPAAWASPEWRKAFPKPRGLPITLLRGRDGKLVLAEKGQMFAEDVEAIAQML